MRTVFIPSVPSRYDPLTGQRVPSVDLSKAESFGALKPLTEMRSHYDFSESIEEVRDGMAHFRKGDAVVAVGDVILVAAAIAYACDMFGSVQVLRWDREQREYNPIEVEL